MLVGFLCERGGGWWPRQGKIEAMSKIVPFLFLFFLPPPPVCCTPLLLLERRVNLDTLEDICRELEVLIGVLVAMQLRFTRCKGHSHSFDVTCRVRPHAASRLVFQLPDGRRYFPCSLYRCLSTLLTSRSLFSQIYFYLQFHSECWMPVCRGHSLTLTSHCVYLLSVNWHQTFAGFSTRMRRTPWVSSSSLDHNLAWPRATVLLAIGYTPCLFFFFFYLKCTAKWAPESCFA